MVNIKVIIKNIILFLILSVVYFLIEFFYRGSTFIIMGLIGGLSGILVGLVNEYIRWDTLFWKQGFYAMFIILFIELVSGLIFNRNYIYWDYRQEYFNVSGQICLKFALIWYFIGLFAIFLDDLFRWIIFKEEKPYYKLF